MVRRARHNVICPFWNPNNALVFEMIMAVTHDTDAWHVIRSYSSRQNGRAAYFTLVSTYRGQGHTDRYRTMAQTTLTNLYWKGAKKSFTWDMFISRLKGAYDELEIQGDQRQDIAKVNDLLTKTKDDSALEHARAHIRGSPTLIADFQGAINYMTVQVMAKMQDQSDNRGRRQISSVESRNRNGNGGGGSG